MRAFIDSTSFSNDGMEGLVEAIRKLPCGHVIFGTPVPFTNDFKDPPPKGFGRDVDVVFGSTGFVDRCRHHGLPTFDSFGPNPSFCDILPHYLNVDGRITSVSQMKDLKFPMFVKPCREKLFSGFVATSWDEVASIETPSSVNILNESVQVSSPKRFGPEARLFYVEGEFVTGSWYKGKRGEIADGELVDFANSLVIEEPPDEAFVIDIAVTAVGFKVVELNNFNSAGLYDADPQKIAQAIYHWSSWDPDFS